MATGTIFHVKRFSVSDGPGIRTTVYLKGCPLECLWCRYPEGRSSEPQLMQFEGDDQKSELVGYVITPEALMGELERDRKIFKQSGGGVTFSGGEPMKQTDFLLSVLKLAKDRHFHTAVDTTGFSEWENYERIASYVDLWLFDVKQMDDELHKKYCGVSNQLILENLRRLDDQEANIVLRLPIVPNMNDDADSLNRLAYFAQGLKHTRRATLMPYRKLDEQKYFGLGMPVRLPHTNPPTHARMRSLQQQLQENGLDVDIQA